LIVLLEYDTSAICEESIAVARSGRSADYLIELGNGFESVGEAE